ncbi:ADP-ribosylglycohydrolase family protein [Kitasatospora sp. NBC_00240]|uniref:ADP-ribosylglycohydrolase family protein n=1 Tax=Kitasatospora sp. NBC_00240 TaxID=2903567 RepID=UPI00225A64DA|nr:ADP-ribosylglycohydrolase family protein [Kitasatospora sp. NBC_00240]MCX5216215.1 ADP-ribosylglycohydrolase family protein [Kitasatospora sp. NBC_00240]
MELAMPRRTPRRTRQSRRTEPIWQTPTVAPRLDERRTDRAAGVLLGAAVGDALGVPYEFKPTLRPDQRPMMIGGGLGPYAPGEYSDDTQMQLCIAEVAATGADLRTTEALDRIADNIHHWRSNGCSDIGSQTSAVLGAARRSNQGSSSQAMLDASRHFTATHDRSAGNGSLMRTSVIALAYLDDPTAMAEAAALVSSLTHADLDCVDACVLWCSGVRTAVLDGTFNGVRNGIALLPHDRQAKWTKILDEAEAHPPHHFNPNGWVVAALQAAWSAITRTPVPPLLPGQGSFPAQHFQLALEAAVRSGNDTDTVAAIAGALLGARWGCSGIPLSWQQAVNGWPSNTSADLIRLAVLTARGGQDDTDGWPSAPRVRTPVFAGAAFSRNHPHDPDVVLGNLTLTEFTGRAPADAVISLCRVGSDPILTGTPVEHVRVWLVDKPGANANLHFVLDQAARELLRLRLDGRRVLLHCVAGRSRTPAVAALYSYLFTGTAPKAALRDVHNALDGNWTLHAHLEMHDAVYELTTGDAPSPPERPSRIASWLPWR